MKLILLTALVIKYTVDANEQFAFPPQFHKPNSGPYGSESSIFLPPEAYTPIPHFSMKNVNNLQYPYLPPTGTKAPSVFPSPFPVILSSTLVPIFDDEDDEKDDEHKNNKIRMSSPLPPIPQMNHNISESSHRTQLPVKREMRATPKIANYHNPIERIDMRFPSQFSLGPTTPNPINQSPRNMIIDTHRNDFGIDQFKSPSAQSPHYIAAPGFTISSTTEPAIPIIRLSNEMDLDGSFSYEALGADQTHYVQHSHMENMGTDKQEQVVEGSYSYVGDNGQTYTVHYIADSNGFRASGDHLPVAPPIPEIIQRAVQYNLAEEAKKPPHLRTWNENENEYHSSDTVHQFAVPPPTRSLFTGRTPEAFSYSFSQGSNNDNNLATAASSQIPVKTNSEFIIDQSRPKTNNGPISPQITFVATQGAHVPSMNQQSQQQSISRIFNSDKTTMPQLMNYEANNKESEHEANKNLWRWQYGLNSNNLSQTPDKNTISRSFGEGDDIMINFGEMTPEQYTKMLQSQLEPNTKVNDVVATQFPENHNTNYNYNENNYIANYESRNLNQNYPRHNYYSSVTNNIQNQPTEKPQITTSVSFTSSSSHQPTIKDIYSLQSEHQESKLYEEQESPYEFRRIKSLHTDSTTKPNAHNINAIPATNNNKLSYNYWPHKMSIDNNQHSAVTPIPIFYSTVSPTTIMYSYDHKNDFKPLIKSTEIEKSETTSLAAETTTESIFKTNIFLRSFDNPKTNELPEMNKKITNEPNKIIQNKNIDEPKNVVQNRFVAETKADKFTKFYPYQSKPLNEFKNINKKKTLELAEVLSYITNKNPFESSKIGSKSNSLNFNNYDQNSEMRSQPFQRDNNVDDREHNVRHQTSNFRNINNQEHEELRGIIKNYKVLQRNNNLKSFEQNGYHVHKEVASPSLKMSQSAGLPPLGRAGPSMKTYLPPIYV